MGAKNTTNPVSTVMEITGMSQENIKNYLNVSRQTVVNYMADASKIPNNVIQSLMKLSGLTYEELMGCVVVPHEIGLSKNYSEAYKSLDDKLNVASGIMNFVVGMGLEGNQELINDAKSEITRDFENLKEQIKDKMKKPLICLIGNSNSGISNFCKQIIGDEGQIITWISDLELPIIFHSSEDVSGAFFILRKGDTIEDRIPANGDGLPELKKIVSDVNCADDEILEYHCGIDSDVLQEIDLAIVRIEDISNYYQIDDGIIFLARASNGEMLDPEAVGFAVTFVGDDVSRVNNILIIATWAESFKAFAPKTDLFEEKKVEITDRIVSIIPDGISERMEEAGIAEAIGKQILPLDFGNLSDFETIYTKLDEVLENQNAINRQVALDYIASFCNSIKLTYDERVAQLKQQSEISRVDESIENIDIDALRNLAYEIIEKHRNLSVKRFKDMYKSVMSQESLLSKLEKKGIKNKPSSQTEFVSYISSLLGEKTTEILNSESQQCMNEIKGIIDPYIENAGGSEGKQKVTASIRDVFIHSIGESDNLKKIFSSALLGSIGSELAAGSVATATTTAAFTSNFAATMALGTTATFIFAPAVVGIIVAAGAFGIMSGNWKKRFITKAINAFEEAKIEKKYKSEVDSHWDSLKQTIDELFSAIENGASIAKKNESQINELENADKTKTIQSLTTLYSAACDVYATLKPAENI